MAAPPAYTAPSEGNAVPPQYNANAAPVYNSAAPQAAPQTAQQPNVQYVNQYGQPIQVQQPATTNVTYVNQNGQPIQPPVQQQAQAQPNVVYVNQNGQPIQPQAQPNVVYVNQNGQPIQPTAATVVTQPAQTTTGAAPGGVNDTGTPADAAERNHRIIAFCVGGLGSFLLFVGLCTDSLASATVDYSWYDDYTVHCGWTEIWCSDYCTGTSAYGDLCDLDDDWCTTQGVASFSLILMLVATICGIIATLTVQPFCQVQRCCCTNGTTTQPKALFITASVLCLIAVIVWGAGDQTCMNGTGDLGLGSSMILDIIGMIFCAIAIPLSK